MRLGKQWLAAVALLCASVAWADAPPLRGRIAWPEEWTVFGPVELPDPRSEIDAALSMPEAQATAEQAIEASRRRVVPEALLIPATDDAPTRRLEATRLRVERGATANMDDVFARRQAGDSAYVFVELDSPERQTVTLGMGADWWMQAWLNGEEVFSTLDEGNITHPFSMLNHRVEMELDEGVNVLAVRFIRGVSSAVLGLGGPAEFALAEEREAARLRRMALNVLPERFEDRLVFPVEEQAVATARWSVELPPVDREALARGGLMGVRTMPERQVLMGRLNNHMTVKDTLGRRFDEPVAILLSKHRYPWEDRCLDAVVWTTPPREGQAPRGALEVILKDAEGAALARHEIEELSPNGIFFSVGFPGALRGSGGSLEVVWREGGNEVGRAKAPFRVKPPSGVARSGRVPLRVLNEPGATISSAPMTVGMPFPRGALDSPANVRLVDEGGAEIPLQAKETARWSRYGPVKWLLCDFTVNLAGEPREVYLEYGPDVQRAERSDIAIGDLAAGFPALDAGRVRVDADGLSFDAAGDGSFRRVLSPQAMLGAFVTHEDGRTYTMPADAEYAFEELGGEKAVVRRTGWYVESETGDRFCQFVTRFVFHRDSPVVRVFHTWIFTGDGNKDRIADMGWRFGTAQPVSNGGFLTAFEGGEWVSGESLVQFDYQRFLLPDTGSEHEGRTPGVLSARVGDTLVSFGAKDFWENFPSEIEVGADGFAFYNWPRRNPPARFERPVAVTDAFRNRFAHEGEVLDFRIPEEYTRGPIWQQATLSGRYSVWEEGQPESVNAQGIARTEEMFLFLADASFSAGEATKVLQGLNDDTLRAVADPAWVCASGAFGGVHPRDVENYPEAERVFETGAGAPARWVERLGFYGMWLHGDYPTWNMKLDGRTVPPYRTLRKNHSTQGTAYPYPWLPYVRTGDPRFLKLAEAGTRQMLDANFCHYATADVDAAVAAFGSDYYRRQGLWRTSVLPWAGQESPYLRCMAVDSDYMWHSYYLTGFSRARDVALLFGELTKHDFQDVAGPRTSEGTIVSYFDMYQATFDPWFIVAAHETARLHRHLFADLGTGSGRQEIAEKWNLWPDTAGHTWAGADLAFYRHTGSAEHRQVALNNAVAWSSTWGMGNRTVPNAGWGGGKLAQAAFAWEMTGDEYYLARVAAALDAECISGYDGETEYLRGMPGGPGGGGHGGWAGGGIPKALAVLHRAGRVPEPVHSPFIMFAARPTDADAAPESEHHVSKPFVFVRKDGQKPMTLFFDSSARGRYQRQRESQPEHFAWEASHAGGEYGVGGAWRPPERFDIPRDAPEGVYRVVISARVPYPEGSADSERRTIAFRLTRMLLCPISLPETPEVILFAPHPRRPGTDVVAPGQGFWFMVPEGMERFWIEFQSWPGTQRRIVWNPDRERVVDLSYTGDPPGRIEIPVPPEHAGRLWRATGGPFVIDPEIPPYFSVSRRKWFNPEE